MTMTFVNSLDHSTIGVFPPFLHVFCLFVFCFCFWPSFWLVLRQTLAMWPKLTPKIATPLPSASEGWTVGIHYHACWDVSLNAAPLYLPSQWVRVVRLYHEPLLKTL